MPRVTDEHKEGRREEILDAATTCFANRGFQGTSMGDIIEASGLSTGAIYSYFKSKREIAIAVAKRAIGTYVHTAMRDYLASGTNLVSPSDLVRVFFNEFERRGIPASIIVQLWGEAINDADFHTMMLGQVGALFDSTRDVIAQWGVATGRVEEENAGSWAESVVPALMALFQGYIAQKALFPNFSQEAYLAAVDGLLVPSGSVS